MDNDRIRYLCNVFLKTNLDFDNKNSILRIFPSENILININRMLIYRCLLKTYKVFSIKLGTKKSYKFGNQSTENHHSLR